MKKTPRLHQVKGIDLLRGSLRTGHKRVMLQAPTGYGKTLLGSILIDGALRKGKRAMFVVPTIALIDQTVERLAEDGITAVGVIQAQHPRTDPSQPVQVCSIQTLANRTPSATAVQEMRKRPEAIRDEDGKVVYEDVIDKDGSVKSKMVTRTVNKLVTLDPIPDSDLVIIDEAHAWFEFYAEWMQHERWSRVPFIGLSATPWTKGLGKHYDDLVIPITISELIEKGFLSPFRVFAPSHPDLSEVRTVAGEYNQEDLSGVMNQGGLVADVVDNWIKHGEGRPTFCFCVDRAHAAHLQAQFRSKGVNAAYVDANTTAEERDAIKDGFHDGSIEVVCNIGVLTKGIDWDVRCIIFAKPTRSEMLFVQCIGRGLRTAGKETRLGEKKDCLIFDHADNHMRLGFVTDINHDTLDDGNPKPKAEREAKEQTLPKECSKCGMLKPPKVKECPGCGFTAVKRSDITCEDGDLVEIRPGERKAEKYTME